MSIKGTILLTLLAVGGFGALMAAIPGSPIWDIFHPPRSVAFPVVEAAASSGQPTETPPALRDLKIITLLSRDAIPAILEDSVRFLTGADAAGQMLASDRIIGVSVNGDHRAYSISQLSSHEVVNDTVGGVPVAVTW